MDELVTDVVERLRRGRSTTWLRIIDEARLDEPVVPDDDVAAIVEPFRWLIERTGGGLPLTQAGYLPPAVVAEMMDALGWVERYAWMGRGNREEHARPVRELRASATRLGLIRLAKGRLSTTRAGQRLQSDPVGLWWHVASRLPDARSEADRHGGVLVLLLTAAGRPVTGELIAVGLAVLGWVDRSTGRPIPRHDVIPYIRDTRHLLEYLGLLTDRWVEREQEPPSSAAVNFVRAALVGRGAVSDRPVSHGTEEAVELTVTLRDITPPIWRRLVVPTSLTLGQTHTVFQTAMGWLDAHLHSFEVGGVLYGDVEDFADEFGEEDSTTLADVRREHTAFVYEYDFGDGWQHDVVMGAAIELPGPVVPHVVDGARACPPEDCGGPWGYQHLVDVMADPQHEDHATLLDWTDGGFDPEAFLLATVNAELELRDRHTRRGGDPVRTN